MHITCSATRNAAHRLKRPPCCSRSARWCLCCFWLQGLPRKRVSHRSLGRTCIFWCVELRQVPNSLKPRPNGTLSSRLFACIILQNVRESCSTRRVDHTAQRRATITGFLGRASRSARWDVSVWETTTSIFPTTNVERTWIVIGRARQGWSSHRHYER